MSHFQAGKQGTEGREEASLDPGSGCPSGVAQVLAGIECDHAQMAECHPGCGHFSCPCGVSWDEGAEGPW